MGKTTNLNCCRLSFMKSIVSMYLICFLNHTHDIESSEKKCPNFCCEDELSIEAFSTKQEVVSVTSDPSTVTDAAAGMKFPNLDEDLVFRETENWCSLTIDVNVIPIYNSHGRIVYLAKMVDVLMVFM